MPALPVTHFEVKEFGFKGEQQSLRASSSIQLALAAGRGTAWESSMCLQPICGG